MDQTLKGIYSLEDHKYLLSIDEDHMEETSTEDSEDYKEIKTIGIDQIVISKKTLVNLINQHVMNKYPDHGYTISQLLDYKVDKVNLL